MKKRTLRSICIVGAVIGVWPLTATNAAVTYNFSTTAVSGYAPVYFTLTTADYINFNTSFGSGSLSSCSGGGPVGSPGTCQYVVFLQASQSSPNTILLGTSNGDLMFTFASATAFSQNGVYAGSLPPHALASSLAVSGTATAALPEPATWAMMVGGFGATGAALRRRRTMNARVRYA